MRIAVEVCPLSHPRTGIGNYIRGALVGLRGGRRRASTSSSPSRRRRRRGRRDPRGARGHPGRACGSSLPFAHARAHGLEPRSAGLRQSASWARSTSSTSGSGGIRRSGPGSGRRRSTTSCRCGSPEWVTPRTRRMHGSEVPARRPPCDVVFANSEFTARDVEERLGCRPSGSGSRPRAWTRATARTAAARISAGRTCSAVGTRAAQEPRHAGRGPPAAGRRAGAGRRR